MGFPAFLIPETSALPGLPPVDPAALAQVSAEVRRLLDEVRRAPPAEGTAEEAGVLLRVSIFGLSSLRLVGPGFVEVMRAHLDEALKDLVRQELTAAEPERKLALRHVEQAVHRYGVLSESLGAALGAIPASGIVTLLDELAEQVSSGVVPLTDADRVILRFQLDVLVALDVLDGSLEELSFWAFRAITDARRVEAMQGPFIFSGVSGELARIRAARSWVGWDAAELAKELAPWPSPSR